jgi:hypothetical protein
VTGVEQSVSTRSTHHLVVVPSDELDKVVVEGDTGLGVKDGRGGGTDEIGRDDLVLSVLEHSLHRTLGGLLDDLLDLVVRSTLLEPGDQVDDGNVRGGDSESHTGKLSVEAGDDLADGLGGTGGRGDDVGTSTSSSTPCEIKKERYKNSSAR